MSAIQRTAGLWERILPRIPNRQLWKTGNGHGAKYSAVELLAALESASLQSKHVRILAVEAVVYDGEADGLLAKPQQSQSEGRDFRMQ